MAAACERRNIKVAQQDDDNSRNCCRYCKRYKEATENRYIAQKSYHISFNPFSSCIQLQAHMRSSSFHCVPLSCTFPRGDRLIMIFVSLAACSFNVLLFYNPVDASYHFLADLPS